MIRFGPAVQDVQNTRQVIERVSLRVIQRKPSIRARSVTLEQVIDDDALAKLERLVGFLVPC